MGLGCGASCAKLILFVFNFVFFVAGAAILGVGIWLKVDPQAFNYLKILQVNQNDQLIQAAIIVLICVGAFIFLVGFLGCCGACRESSCMLCTYAVLLGLVLTLLIVAGILAAVFRGKVDSFLQNDMTKQVRINYKYPAIGNNDALTKAWNAMHYGLKCCGSTGPLDFYQSNWYNASIKDGKPGNETVPVSCCVPKSGANDGNKPDPLNFNLCMMDAAATPIPANSSYLFTKGCHPSLRDKIYQYSYIVIGVAFGLLIIQVIGICLACCVRNAINDQ